MKYLERIQTLLPLGYLYLIVLGILKDGLQYYQLGINILQYSSITDILISPVADICSSPILLIGVVFLLICFVIFQNVVIKFRHKSWAQKMFVGNSYNPESDKKQMRKQLFPFIVALMAIALLSFFVGIGGGEGARLASRLTNTDYTYNYKVNFSTGKPEDVFLFGRNSSYYFYVTKDNKHIKIAPASSITSLEMINNKKLQ